VATGVRAAYGAVARAYDAQVMGIDLSPGMITIARQRAPELTWAVGSMLQLPISDGAWSAAVALSVSYAFRAGLRAGPLPAASSGDARHRGQLVGWLVAQRAGSMRRGTARPGSTAASTA
jgi:SAM-dependent methyltransferase